MKWAASLFLSQGTRLCSVALLSSLQSLQCSLSGGNKRYWYTWTSIMGTIASLMPASLIYSSHFSVLPFIHFLFILSLRSCSWSRWWFTRWLLALISVRAVLWWRELFVFFPSISHFSSGSFSLSCWSLWIRTCCFWGRRVSPVRPSNWRATISHSLHSNRCFIKCWL